MNPSLWKMTDIRKDRYTEEQIISLIKQAEAGMPINELGRNNIFNDAAFSNRWAKHGGCTCPKSNACTS
jgi:putative transposase